MWYIILGQLILIFSNFGTGLRFGLNESARMISLERFHLFPYYFMPFQSQKRVELIFCYNKLSLRYEWLNLDNINLRSGSVFEFQFA